MEAGGFRDLVSALDCLRYQVRVGNLTMHSARKEAEFLLEQANVSLDPRVARIFIPAILEVLKEFDLPSLDESVRGLDDVALVGRHS